MALNNPFAAPNPYPVSLSLMLLVVIVAMLVWLHYGLQQLLDTAVQRRRNSNARDARGRINELEQSDYANKGFRFDLDEVYYAGDGRFEFDDFWAELNEQIERLDRHRRELRDQEDRLVAYGELWMGHQGRLHVLDRIQEAFEESLDAHDRHLDDHGHRLRQLHRRQDDTEHRLHQHHRRQEDMDYRLNRQSRMLQWEAGELRRRLAALEAQRLQGNVAEPGNGLYNMGQPAQGPHPSLQPRPQAAQEGLRQDLCHRDRLQYDQHAAQRARHGLKLRRWAPSQSTENSLPRPYAHNEPHSTVARHEANQPRRPAPEIDRNPDIHPTQQDRTLGQFRRVRHIIRQVGHQRVAESLARLQQAAAEARQIHVAQDITSGTIQSRGSAENATTDEDQSHQQRRHGHPLAENASNSADATAAGPSGGTADARSRPRPQAETNALGAYVESADEEQASDGAQDTPTEHASDATADPDEAANGRRGSSSSSGSIPIVLDLRFEGARERQQ